MGGGSGNRTGRNLERQAKAFNSVGLGESPPGRPGAGANGPPQRVDPRMAKATVAKVPAVRA